MKKLRAVKLQFSLILVVIQHDKVVFIRGIEGIKFLQVFKINNHQKFSGRKSFLKKHLELTGPR